MHFQIVLFPERKGCQNREALNSYEIFKIYQNNYHPTWTDDYTNQSNWRAGIYRMDMLICKGQKGLIWNGEIKQIKELTRYEIGHTQYIDFADR